MTVDDEPPAPSPGDTMDHIGIRLLGGSAELAGNDPDEICEVLEASPGQTRYLATGVIEDSRDWESDVNGKSQHAGCELVLVVDGLRFQVMLDGHARDWPEGIRVAATGTFEFIGEYEWDGFLLVDTRTAWAVHTVEPASNGDLMVDIARITGDT